MKKFSDIVASFLAFELLFPAKTTALAVSSEIEPYASGYLSSYSA